MADQKEKKKLTRKAHHQEKTFYRDNALRAAKDLCYGHEVTQQILDAKNDDEIVRIMQNARRNKE